MVAASVSLVALAMFGSLDLEAPGVDCPDVQSVRAGLSSLGVDLGARTGVATWRRSGEVLVLRVEVRTASISVTERVLPSLPCGELADAVALAIERATAPLGAAVPARTAKGSGDARASESPVRADVKGMGVTRTATSADPSPGRSWGLALFAGPSVLVSRRVEPGLSFGLSVWPVAAFGALVGAGVAIPSSYDVEPASLELQRFHVELGPALRVRPKGAVEIGVGALLLVDHLRGTPSGLETSTSVRDVRLGGVLAPWAAWSVGSLGLRLGVDVRVFGAERTYRAVPATELVTLPVIEALVSLSAGYVRGETD